MKKLIAAFVIALAAILAARLSFFTVEEGRAALVLGWNKSVSAEVTEPGLHVKLPDPIERTAMIDCRGQSLQVSALEPKGEGSSLKSGGRNSREAAIRRRAKSRRPCRPRQPAKPPG